MQWYHSKITTICSLEIAFLLAGDGDSAATVHHQIGPSSFRQFYLISRPTTRNHFPPDVHLLSRTARTRTFDAAVGSVGRMSEGAVTFLGLRKCLSDNGRRREEHRRVSNK